MTFIQYGIPIFNFAANKSTLIYGIILMAVPC